MKPEEVDDNVIRTLARVAGIDVPEEDIEPLIGAYRNHLAGMKVLDQLELDEHDPLPTFDATWR
jgi:hypothetical protein